MVVRIMVGGSEGYGFALQKRFLICMRDLGDHGELGPGLHRRPDGISRPRGDGVAREVPGGEGADRSQWRQILGGGVWILGGEIFL